MDAFNFSSLVLSPKERSPIRRLSRQQRQAFAVQLERPRSRQQEEALRKAAKELREKVQREKDSNQTQEPIVKALSDKQFRLPLNIKNEEVKLEDLMAKSGILEKKASVCQRQVTQTLSDTVPLAQKQASYDNWLENMESNVKELAEKQDEQRKMLDRLKNKVAMREALGKRLLSEGMSPESFQTTTADHSFEDWAKKLAPLTNTQPKTYYLAGIYENNKDRILREKKDKAGRGLAEKYSVFALDDKWVHKR